MTKTLVISLATMSGFLSAEILSLLSEGQKEQRIQKPQLLESASWTGEGGLLEV